MSLAKKIIQIKNLHRGTVYMSTDMDTPETYVVKNPAIKEYLKEHGITEPYGDELRPIIKKFKMIILLDRNPLIRMSK